MFSRKQRRRIRRATWSAVIIMIVVLGVFLLIEMIRTKKKVTFARYPEFGILIPENYSIHGIDVSKYQDMIVWEEVKAMRVKNVQIGFSFIKATEGIGNTDPRFKRNWKRSGDNKMIRGAYHFFIGSKDGKMQAENFIDKVELEPGDLPPVLDIEQLNGAASAEVKKEAKEWLDVVENYYKVKPIIYTNVDFYTRHLGSEFDAYPLWIAHYYQQQQPKINRDWIFWQHSDEGRVNGINSPVDFNVFNGDSLAFRGLLLR